MLQSWLQHTLEAATDGKVDCTLSIFNCKIMFLKVPRMMTLFIASLACLHNASLACLHKLLAKGGRTGGGGGL